MSGYSEIPPDEKRGSCLRFLFNALRFFRRLGVKVERVMTDNGSSFRSRRYAKSLRRLRIRHLRTKPYTPKTNGKVERFVQTSLREWAYARAYDTSQQRAAEVPIGLHRYNWHRPHGSIGAKPPISRLNISEDSAASWRRACSVYALPFQEPRCAVVRSEIQRSTSSSIRATQRSEIEMGAGKRPSRRYE
jgi:hypothetical protein